MIEFEGIGMPPDMSLNIDGLTVIAGRNGTGKSTVLRAIHHMLGPSENVDDSGP